MERRSLTGEVGGRSTLASGWGLRGGRSWPGVLAPVAIDSAAVQGCATNGRHGGANGRDLKLAEKADPDFPGSASMRHDSSQPQELIPPGSAEGPAKDPELGADDRRPPAPLRLPAASSWLSNAVGPTGDTSQAVSPSPDIVRTPPALEASHVGGTAQRTRAGSTESTNGVGSGWTPLAPQVLNDHAQLLGPVVPGDGARMQACFSDSRNALSDVRTGKAQPSGVRHPHLDAHRRTVTFSVVDAVALRALPYPGGIGWSPLSTCRDRKGISGARRRRIRMKETAMPLNCQTCENSFWNREYGTPSYVATRRSKPSLGVPSTFPVLQGSSSPTPLIRGIPWRPRPW